MYLYYLHISIYIRLTHGSGARRMCSTLVFVFRMQFVFTEDSQIL